MKKYRVKKSRIKRLGSFFRQATDYGRIIESFVFIKHGLRRLFVIQQPKRRESFTQAQQRLQLDESQIQTKMRAFKRLASIMLIVAIFVFSYSCIRLIQGHWHSAIFSFVLTTVSLTLAFRYHFWFFQVKQRKLGCSFEEWFKYGLLRKSN